MSIQSKRFQNNNDSSDVVTIIGDNGVFYNLSNGANIKKDIFFQKYSEMIDPSSFFEQQSRAGLEDLAEKLKTVDSRKAVDGNQPPTVKYVQEPMTEQVEAPKEYRDMLLKRFEAEQANKDLSQYKVYDDDELAAADFDRKLKEQHPPKPPRQKPQRMDDGPWQGYGDPPQEPLIEHSQPQSTSSTPSYVSQEEEAFRFFKSFKKVYPIKLTVDFDEKIAEPAFIKLMAVNYEGDIIKYYTKEFMNRIFNDPGFLENKIYQKLKSLVFEEEEKKEIKKRVPKKTTTTKTLTEGKEKRGNKKDVVSQKPSIEPKSIKKNG